MSRITCTEFEILLADYLDGTLGSGHKANVEAHRNDVRVCAELAPDAAGARGSLSEQRWSILLRH